jgi:hypothetical protein
LLRVGVKLDVDARLNEEWRLDKLDDWLVRSVGILVGSS